MALQDRDARRQDRKKQLRSIYEYTMGVLWIGIGLLFVLNKHLDLDWLKTDPLLDYLIGFVFLAYGGYRIYRGYARIDR